MTVRRLVVALATLALHASASCAPQIRPTFQRPVKGHAEDLEFSVPVQARVDGDCLSYWGNKGKNWATLLISKTLILQLAKNPVHADQVKRLLANLRPKLDDWGCQHIQDLNGAPLALIFDLLESGTLVVIDDASAKPVEHILVRYSRNERNSSTYHLSANATAFLTKDPWQIQYHEVEEQRRLLPRPQWRIENSANTSASRNVIEFAKKFVASCMSENAAERSFFIDHISLPLKVRFSVVDENGAHGEVETVHKLRLDIASGEVGLPLCFGDGGLDDAVLHLGKAEFTIDLPFGSGPQEELHFQKVQGKWMLTFAEWFDH